MSMKRQNAIILIGPPGSGKGTQATVLSAASGFSVFSMGEVLRQEAATASERGQTVQMRMQRGELVPDELIFEMVHERLTDSITSQTIIFDGFPRTVDQAQRLDEYVDVLCALNIAVSNETCIQRMAGRKRADDTDEAVARRLALYHELTRPVLSHYQALNKLITIDGEPSVSEETKPIEKAVRVYVS